MITLTSKPYYKVPYNRDIMMDYDEYILKFPDKTVFAEQQKTRYGDVFIVEKDSIEITRCMDFKYALQVFINHHD